MKNRRSRLSCRKLPLGTRLVAAFLIPGSTGNDNAGEPSGRYQRREAWGCCWKFHTKPLLQPKAGFPPAEAVPSAQGRKTKPHTTQSESAFRGNEIFRQAGRCGVLTAHILEEPLVPIGGKTSVGEKQGPCAGVGRVQENG